MPGNELIGNEEFEQLKDLFKNGCILYRYGFDEKRSNIFKVQQFENEFASFVNVKYALAVSSGTAALRTALASCGLKNGDEVITQSFTFVATVEAIVESGLKPICIEIDEYLNLNAEKLREAITPRTKAVIVVHMLGISANMDAIKSICDEHNLILIEDTAWGLGGKYKEKFLGTIGDIGCFSFDYAKAITTGEGGMLVFKDSNKYEKAKQFHDHGHENNKNLQRWEDSRSISGFNFRMSELQGAVGIAQLRKLNLILQKQITDYQQIKNILKASSKVKLRDEPSESLGSYDAIVMQVKDLDNALNLKKIFAKQGIPTKILPEALTWHFAKFWDHIPELNLIEDINKRFVNSNNLLEKCIAIPNNFNKQLNFFSIVEVALSEFESAYE